MTDKGDESMKGEGGGSNDVSDELSDLLDSSLKDFKPRPRTTDDELDELMAIEDQKTAQKAASEFQHMLQQMVQVQEEAIRKAEEAAADKGSEEDAESKEMMEALKQLMNCSDKVANASSQEEFMDGLNMLKDPNSPMEPLMQMLMETFVSKSMMYPPLKEIHDKFPQYLSQHERELDDETKERYNKQYEVIGKILIEFEKQDDEPKETPAAPTQEKQGEGQEEVNACLLPPNLAEYQTLAELLVELQTYGYPPPELVGQMPNGWAVDESTGMPKVEDASAAADGCPIM